MNVVLTVVAMLLAALVYFFSFPLVARLVGKGSPTSVPASLISFYYPALRLSALSPKYRSILNYEMGVLGLDPLHALEIHP